MNAITISDLPDELLGKIFERLDVQSRVRCESVCRKFHDVASLIYASHPWLGLRKGKITLVISAWCRFSDILTDMENVCFDADGARITILNRGKEDCGIKRREEWFGLLLDSILAKFVSYVGTLELHNAEINSNAMELLLNYHDRIDGLKILGCRFSRVRLTDVARFRTVYGEKLNVAAKCECEARLREMNARLREQNDGEQSLEDTSVTPFFSSSSTSSCS